MPREDIERDEANAPSVLAFLVCESVQIDPGSGKPTIVECFREIEGLHFPMKHPNFAVFVEITDGRGLVPLRVRIADIDQDDPPLAEAGPMEVDFANPLSTRFG